MTRPLDDDAIRRLTDVGAEPEPDAGTSRDTVGPYRILGELGSGGMGVVYEAEDTRLGRRVALKVLREHAGASTTLRQRFAREALAAARLQHPNIAAIYEATPDYIAMQLVEGVSLQAVPRDDARHLAALLATAADAVDYAHRAGIVHRDLKPTNFMVTGSGPDASLYVLDFGLAKETTVESSLSVTGHLLGTPEYMAPEQARGSIREVDERTDVYGLGATLYACLAGRPPFAGDDLLDILRQIGDDEPPPLRRLRTDIDRDLETLVRKAMAKEPEARYARARELGDDLRRWLAAEPILARRPSLAYKMRKFARRRSAPLKAAGVATLLVGIAGIVLVASERATRRGTEQALQLSNAVSALIRDAEDAFRAGHKDVRDEKLLQAESLCAEALARSDVPHGHYLMGSILYEREKFREALAALDRALTLDPDLDEARFLRGLVLVDFVARPPEMGGPPTSLVTGHYLEQARKDLAIRETSELSFRSVDALFGEALLARLQDGDTARSRRHLERIVYDLDVAHVGALRELGRMLLEEDPDEARRLNARAMDLERGVGVVATLSTHRARPPVGPVLPDAGPVVDLEAESSRSAPAHDLGMQALARMQEAVEHRSGGRIAEALDSWREAIAITGDAIRDCPASIDPKLRAGLLNNRGVGRSEIDRILDVTGKRFEAMRERMQALTDFGEALEIDPQCAPALVNRGRLRTRHARTLLASEQVDAADQAFETALADYEKALTLLPAVSAHRDSAEAALRALERERGKADD